MDTVTLTIEEYEDLVDARDHAVAMQGVAAGAVPVLNQEEAAAYLAAVTPLAFWRAHRGLTVAGLAARAGLAADEVAAFEAGAGVRDVMVYRKLAEALGVRIADLLGE